MRSGLIVLGMIFLVFGGIFYFLPVQETTATTTTISGGDAARTAYYTTFVVPIQLILAMLISGLALFVFGLVLSGPVRTVVKEPHESSTIEETKRIESGDGKRKKFVERHKRVSHA